MTEFEFYAACRFLGVVIFGSIAGLVGIGCLMICLHLAREFWRGKV